MEKICKKCGDKFTVTKYPNRKYCSPECNPWISTSITYKNCQECGAKLARKSNNGPPPKYCSEGCRWAAHYKRNPEKYSGKCDYCGKIIPVRRFGYKTKHCSAECRSKVAFKNKERECVVCGKVFKGSHPGKCCSSECQIEQTNKTIKESGKREPSIEKTCANCGKNFFVGYFQQWAEACSKSCSDAWYRSRNPDKVAANNARRRMREEVAFVEHVNPFDIFERDKWKCKLCGKKVNKDHRHPHPMSASIDHIIPLSKGGKHTKDNVRLAHLRCNVSRGNRDVMAVENGQFVIVI